MICIKNEIFTLAAAIVPYPFHLGIHKNFLQNSFGNNGKNTRQVHEKGQVNLPAEPHSQDVATEIGSTGSCYTILQAALP